MKIREDWEMNISKQFKTQVPKPRGSWDAGSKIPRLMRNHYELSIYNLHKEGKIEGSACCGGRTEEIII